MTEAIWRSLAVTLTAAIAVSGAAAQERNPDPKEVQAVLNKAKDYLLNHQKEDGSFSNPKFAGPGVTALVAAALAHNGISPDEPVVAKALANLEKNVKDDGGVYNKILANYTTSIALMAFKEANKGGRYDTVLKNGASFLKKLQHDEPESLTSDTKYGGFGYDAKSRPDLSNTGFTVEALIAAGVPKNDPAIQKALKFISRCQNLAGEHNDQEFAKKADKDDVGGFTYNPIDPDKSQYKTATGGLRSLGGMTYSGLKSFLYAGVGKDDERVKAALRWIKEHYTLEQNPGMGKAGLYYYYHTFAKAMNALGEEEFTDAAGKKHLWRAELFEALKSRQRADGSWINQGDRAYGESDPDLATAFAVLSLSYCRPPSK
jgi:squalene-hopene/tetraprenyl-beta-curcumene cyclase